MGIFFESYQAKVCCLCGSGESLTGEHKIKASALRKIFGKDRMVIGNFDGESIVRPAQGPKSEAFHFTARMCSTCNGARTQAADREFDRFHALVSARLLKGEDPSSVFDLPQYEIGSEAYLNVFRYFSKLLCCHVAESSGPRPLDVSRFAIGAVDRNVVWLRIDADPTYQDFREAHGEHKYAAHGGLIVPVDSTTRRPTSFISSISLGAVRYRFWTNLLPISGEALRWFHRAFWDKCQAAHKDAVENPLSDKQKRRLGV
ncbi:hypothetical protein [Pseudomonas hamedanensis]|uniref:Uncharacterized protein n=1 Tax=Pseudomonas hamedanensis TaxID=2745504 RepID=A0A9E6NW74_9PSED|nr:hypothetical protein [Pseudomonas hamedanensis]QXI14968.1 hypothetical protein HU739_013590 [Pseudomonas hamedanensis]